MVRDRTFICITFSYTFSLVPWSRSSLKVKYRGHNFQKMAITGAVVFHKYSLFTLVFSECTVKLLLSNHLREHKLLLSNHLREHQKEIAEEKGSLNATKLHHTKQE